MDAVPQPPAKKDDERTTIIAMIWVRAQDSIQIWEISFQEKARKLTLVNWQQWLSGLDLRILKD